MCRHLTELDCRDTDMAFQEHGRRHRQLSYSTDHNPNLGDIKVLVLLVQFKDHKNRPMVDRKDIETLWKTKIRHWFRVNSYGKYNVDPTFVSLNAS